MNNIVYFSTVCMVYFRCIFLVLWGVCGSQGLFPKKLSFLVATGFQNTAMFTKTKQQNTITLTFPISEPIAGFEMMECSIINSSTTAAVKQIVPLIGKDPMQIIFNIFIFLMAINIAILKTWQKYCMPIYWDKTKLILLQKSIEQFDLFFLSLAGLFLSYCSHSTI